MNDMWDRVVVWEYRMDFLDGHTEWVTACDVHTAVASRRGGKGSEMPLFCWNMTMWERMMTRIAKNKETPWQPAS